MSYALTFDDTLEASVERVRREQLQAAFDGLRELTGPNYRAIEGTFTITRGNETVAVLHPQKRVYRVQTNPMTEAGISVGWTRDLFVALGDDLGDDAWSVRVQYKPLIRYIWLGAWIMALGGLVATMDRRYRARRVTEPAPAAGAMAREPG